MCFFGSCFESPVEPTPISDYDEINKQLEDIRNRTNKRLKELARKDKNIRISRGKRFNNYGQFS